MHDSPDGGDVEMNEKNKRVQEDSVPASCD